MKFNTLFGDIDRWIENNNKLEAKAQSELLETVSDNVYLVYLKISLPWPISSRSSIYLYYKGLENGTVDLLTDQGAEKYHEKYKDKIGKDVLMKFKFCYCKYTPVDADTLNILKVSSIDFAGSFPTMIKNSAMKSSFGEAEKAFEKFRKLLDE